MTPRTNWSPSVRFFSTFEHKQLTVFCLSLHTRMMAESRTGGEENGMESTAVTQGEVSYGGWAWGVGFWWCWGSWGNRTNSDHDEPAAGAQPRPPPPPLSCHLVPSLLHSTPAHMLLSGSRFPIIASPPPLPVLPKDRKCLYFPSGKLQASATETWPCVAILDIYLTLPLPNYSYCCHPNVSIFCGIWDLSFFDMLHFVKTLSSLIRYLVDLAPWSWCHSRLTAFGLWLSILDEHQAAACSLLCWQEDPFKQVLYQLLTK